MTGRAHRTVGLTLALATGASLASIAALSGCGDDLTPTAQARWRLGDHGAAPAYGDAPFPSDAYRDGDRLGAIPGLERLVRSHDDLINAHLGRLDGFGLRPTVELAFDGPIATDAIPPRTTSISEAMFVIDVDPASPERGRVVAYDWRWQQAWGALVGAPVPGEVLREGTTYAAVFTTDLVAADGSPLAAADAVATLSDGGAPARWQASASALAHLAADPAIGDRVAAAAVFTTQTTRPTLALARTRLADRTQVPAPGLRFAEPTLIFDDASELDALLGHATRFATGPRAGTERWGNTNPTGMAHDHVGVIATGTMTATRFRRDDLGDNGPDDETFLLDDDGVPEVVVAAEALPVTFVLPAAPPPASGYPVVVIGHGLGASRQAILSFAEPLTEAGYALVAIDMLGHGSRLDPIDRKNNLAAMLSEFSGDATLIDGFGDRTGLATQFEFFESFLNIAALRDSIRQSALDLSQLVELIRDPALDLTALAGRYGAAPRLDTRHVAYLGESFGAVVGTLFAAIEPDVDLFVLDVPGGGVLDLILGESPEIGSLAGGLAAALYGADGVLDRFHPMVSLQQAVLDGADPLTYAGHIFTDRAEVAGAPLRPRSLVAIVASGDEVMPNVASWALARAAGLTVIAPGLAAPADLPRAAGPLGANRDGQTAVLVEYSPATHGANWTAETGALHFVPGFPFLGDDRYPRLATPVAIANPIYDTFDQVLAILAEHQAGRAPRVTTTRAPVADFDGDGMTDSDELAAGRDPHVPGA